MAESGSSQRQMRLGLFINPTGHHQASWRHPEADADAGISFDHYRRMAQLAEHAKFDAIFLADNLCVREGPPDFISHVAQYVANFEPITTLSALSVVTKHIGLIATASTSFNEPFHIARKFASLDFLSGGRAGWNIVTSGMDIEAYNFGLDGHYEHDFRYDMAKEFVEVCRGLWDSWDDDAFVRNKATGLFSDAAHKLHTLNHVGEHYKVRGPLNVPRCPQGYPLHVQAGSSEAGRSFAAEFGEMIFTTARSIADGQKHSRDLRERAATFGRNPQHIFLMPGLVPLIGRTESEAKDKLDYLQSLLPDEIALYFLKSRMKGVTVPELHLDDPMPDLPPPSAVGSQGTYIGLMELIRRERPTVRQLARLLSGSLSGLPVHGTPTQIADMMQEWFEAGACDGFNIQPPYMPGAFVDFVDLVIPELRRRGLIREEYQGTMLRDHFGLPRPESQYQKARETATV